jgi:hypothetical protein
VRDLRGYALMRWVLVMLLSITGALFFIKGIELWSMIGKVDGDGIGISFLGLSVSDKVLNESISGYALGFTVSSLIPILVAVNIAMKRKTDNKIATEQP